MTTTKSSKLLLFALYRDKCEELFSDLDSYNIPLLIFSAGLGGSIIWLLPSHLMSINLNADTLLEVFRQFSKVRPNMHVVSNRLIFDDAGIAVGHSDPLVHSYNKGKSPEQLAAVAPFIEVMFYVLPLSHDDLPPNRVGVMLFWQVTHREILKWPTVCLTHNMY